MLNDAQELAAEEIVLDSISSPPPSPPTFNFTVDVNSCENADERGGEGRLRKGCITFLKRQRLKNKNDFVKPQTICETVGSYLREAKLKRETGEKKNPNRQSDISAMQRNLFHCPKRIEAPAEVSIATKKQTISAKCVGKP